DSSQCASARETTVAAIRQAMARAGGQQLELDAQDLSPDCRQRGETALDIHALRSGIAAAQTTLSPGHVRPVIVYADDIDLAGSLAAGWAAGRHARVQGLRRVAPGRQLPDAACHTRARREQPPDHHVRDPPARGDAEAAIREFHVLGVGRGLHRELRPLLHPGARSGSLPLGRDGQLRTGGPMRVLIAAALVAEGALAQVRVEPRLFVKAQHIFVSGGLTWLERGDYYNSPGAALSAAYYLREG